MKKLLSGVVFAAGALSLAGCVTHENTHEVVREQPIVREERTTIQQPAPVSPVVQQQTTTVRQQPGLSERTTTTTTSVDPHQTWWAAYHPGEPYDRDHAAVMHRMWCDQHMADASCGTWYAHP
jgi:hypothetical protein